MMKCKHAEKYILENGIISIDEIKERTILKHVVACTNCKKEVEKMQYYFSELSRLKQQKVKIQDPLQFTEDVMNSIRQPRGKLHSGFSLKVGFKIAASIVIIITTGFYLQQSRAISKSNAQLISKYERKAGNSQLITYNDCIEFSNSAIAETLKENEDLVNLFIDSGTHSSRRVIKKYANQICMQADIDLQSSSLEAKKKYVTQFLINEANKVKSN